MNSTTAAIRATGRLDAWAHDVIEAVGSYTELLPTGTGVRVLLLGVLPAHGRKKGNYETYQTGRFIAVTGRRLFGTSVAVEHRQDALLRVHGWFFGGRWWRSAEAVAPPPAECDAVAPDDGPWGNGDRAAWPFSVIDARLQRRLGPWPRRVGSRLFAFGPDGASSGCTTPRRCSSGSVGVWASTVSRHRAGRTGRAGSRGRTIFATCNSSPRPAPRRSRRRPWPARIGLFEGERELCLSMR